MSSNPLENIPITENNNQYTCPPNNPGVSITRFGGDKPPVKSHKESELYIPTALSGDIIGAANCNTITSIQGITIFPNEYPQKGQTFIINENGQLELRSLAKISNLTITPRNGLSMEDGVLSVNCEDLIEHCGLITALNASENFITIEGGQIQNLEVQSLKILNTLNLEAYAEEGKTKIITIAQDGTVNSIDLPNIFSVDLSTKANTNGDNLNIPAFKTALGINNVNNTTDLLKPISTATQTALDLKANVDGSNLNTNLFRAGLLISNVNNTSDLLKPISTATQTALNLKANVDGSNINFTLFKTSMSLNNVDNTSDILKPISTATQVALNSKANDSDVVKLTGTQSISGLKIFNILPQSSSNPVNNNDLVRKGYVDLISTGGGGIWGSITGTLASQTDLQSALNLKEASISVGSVLQYWRGDKTFQLLNKSAVGLDNVDNTTDLLKPVSTATQIALNAKANVLGNNLDVAAFRTALLINNVNNTTDLLKPVSTATQTALNLKANVLGDNLNVPTFRTSLNISNVDNTTDLLKPISTATQTALNIKVDSNPTNITGATAITNIVQLSQANYDAIVSPNASTLYIINN